MLKSLVPFKCQLDWVMECPDIWSDIRGVSVRVFLCESEICIGSLNKEDCFPQCDGGFFWSIEHCKRKHCLPDSFNWDISPILSMQIASSAFLILRPSNGLELHHQLSWISNSPTISLGILSLQNHVCQFLLIHLFIKRIYTKTYPTNCFSGGP